MLPDLYHARYIQKEYERRIEARRLVRLALKARAENAGETTHPLEQLFRSVARLATMPGHWGQRLLRRWSGQPETILSVPMK